MVGNMTQQTQQAKNYLNIGCGKHFHEAWTNIDLVSVSPHVRAYDLRKGLPYAENSYDAVYTSHVLEHLTPRDARASVQEQFRVLRRGGTIRVAVPDLEGVVREYLRQLESVLGGNARAEANYDWMMLELLDQTTRTKVSGIMGDFIMNPAFSNDEYVASRLGEEVRDWIEAARSLSQDKSKPHQPTSASQENTPSFLTKLRAKSPAWIIQKLRYAFADALVGVIAGGEARQSFREGVFRNSGEIHRWMYDRFSLGRLLKEAGCTGVRICRHDESRIPDFASYLLDSTPSGLPRKPDSLFMEGLKP
jgi:SAM-dependent methyltransferase